MAATIPLLNPGRCIIAAIICVLTAGCQDVYLARRDTLTVGSGEAVQANIAKHIIDPWPAHAQHYDRDASGERAQHAIERYRNPGSGPGAGALPPPVPVGSSNAPPIGGSGFR